MIDAQNYLLGKIIGNRENGMRSLGQLEAKFVDDICKVMETYAAETVIDVVKRINEGETILIDGMQLYGTAKIITNP